MARNAMLVIGQTSRRRSHWGWDDRCRGRTRGRQCLLLERVELLGLDAEVLKCLSIDHVGPALGAARFNISLGFARTATGGGGAGVVERVQDLRDPITDLTKLCLDVLIDFHAPVGIVVDNLPVHQDGQLEDSREGDRGCQVGAVFDCDQVAVLILVLEGDVIAETNITG